MFIKIKSSTTSNIMFIQIKTMFYVILVIGAYLKQFNKVDVISKLTSALPDMTFITHKILSFIFSIIYIHLSFIVYCFILSISSLFDYFKLVKLKNNSKKCNYMLKLNHIKLHYFVQAVSAYSC
jgi:hypothetical protein